MKKLGKLTINPEKVIKNEELVNLKGGYGFTCYCYEYGSGSSFYVPAYDLQELYEYVWEECEFGAHCDPA